MGIVQGSGDFDLSTMSDEQVTNKLASLQSNQKMMMELGLDDTPAKKELDSLISEVQKEHEFRVKMKTLTDSSGNSISANELLNMDKSSRDKII